MGYGSSDVFAVRILKSKRDLTKRRSCNFAKAIGTVHIIIMLHL